MDAFETLIAELLRRDGYWTIPSFRVELHSEEKREIGRPTTARWELDVVAYKGVTNELLVVECKSFLDSRGVVFRNGEFGSPKLYKLFNDEVLRTVVFRRLKVQLHDEGFCPANVSDPTLCLAVGKLAGATDRDAMRNYFQHHGWRLFDPDWIDQQLRAASERSYENNIAHVVAKLIHRRRS